MMMGKMLVVLMLLVCITGCGCISGSIPPPGQQHYLRDHSQPPDRTSGRRHRFAGPNSECNHHP